MKNADELFKKLGYRIIENDSKIMVVKDTKNYDCRIIFMKITNDIILEKLDKDDDYRCEFNLIIPELEAINEKCKELGWI